MTRRLPLVPTLIVAVAVAVMIGLGVWQLQRAEWKESLIARYAEASGLPAIAYPGALAKEPPLFRRATGFCLQPLGRRAVAGRNRSGESGYAIIVTCKTGAEGPGIAVELGWSKDPNAQFHWAGGEVKGIIAPDRENRMRLVADSPPEGLQPSAPPSLDSIPNNHRLYAVQWFLFAAIALVIYVLALRQRWKKAEAKA